MFNQYEVVFLAASRMVIFCREIEMYGKREWDTMYKNATLGM